MWPPPANRTRDPNDTNYLKGESVVSFGCCLQGVRGWQRFSSNPHKFNSTISAGWPGVCGGLVALQLAGCWICRRSGASPSPDAASWGFIMSVRPAASSSGSPASCTEPLRSTGPPQVPWWPWFSVSGSPSVSCGALHDWPNLIQKNSHFNAVLVVRKYTRLSETLLKM